MTLVLDKERLLDSLVKFHQGEAGANPFSHDELILHLEPIVAAVTIWMEDIKEQGGDELTVAVGAFLQGCYVGYDYAIETPFRGVPET